MTTRVEENKRSNRELKQHKRSTAPERIETVYYSLVFVVICKSSLAIGKAAMYHGTFCCK